MSYTFFPISPSSNWKILPSELGRKLNQNKLVRQKNISALYQSARSIWEPQSHPFTFACHSTAFPFDSTRPILIQFILSDTLSSLTSVLNYTILLPPSIPPFSPDPQLVPRYSLSPLALTHLAPSTPASVNEYRAVNEWLWQRQTQTISTTRPPLESHPSYASRRPPQGYLSFVRPLFSRRDYTAAEIVAGLCEAVPELLLWNSRGGVVIVVSAVMDRLSFTSVDGGGVIVIVVELNVPVILVLILALLAEK